jgi:hypothetical protein
MGNPKIKEKMELDVQVAKLRVAKTSHQNSQYALQDRLRKKLPAEMSVLERRIASLKADIERRDGDGSGEQLGYRFIWRRPNGDLQGARGQARIPSLADIQELTAIALREGWGHHLSDAIGKGYAD